MSDFINENFILQSDIAQQLYHNYAKDLPIIDYHNHLPPDQICNDHQFDNITEIWLHGDHYKWRAMRTLGVEEKYITGEASDFEKFQKWATVVPQTLRNPLYHWTHMELKNPFGITELLSLANAKDIYEKTKQQLNTSACSTQGLLTHFNVEMVGTTDDPIDSLMYHKSLRDNKNFKTKVLPTFRPDKAFQLAKGDSFRAYLQKLAQISNIKIHNLDSLLEALDQRINYFDSLGCVASDHGLKYLPQKGKFNIAEVDAVLMNVINGDDTKALEVEDSFTFYVLSELSKRYHLKNWVQQFHLGPLRDTNKGKLAILGADTGYDSIGDYLQAERMADFFNYLDSTDQLTKTIIYNVNPADNAVFGTMIANFQEEGVKGKIQFGSGWWFQDQLDGMTEQINALSNYGLISCFVGMLTDSRSFLSYSRHEYFRRLLSNIFAEDIRKGYLPNDVGMIGKMITDICYNNASAYFKK
ncbi:glucuronate isomerase [Sphingobacterium sp. SRCM116780]|uniref:glucuronate isomerase n=1 Tax=Sphingobacterium sp. SRCM116780 TaxID=2907623 RepID=UPI001F44344C|nr:glucuronate isomerase [Sphingobacterium sp. SRCM116780]UIR56402.1 glucuronate isomerase [Sphingobacterium sp. SRCM116780]